MKVITAVEEYREAIQDIKVFLAGGIQKCEDWQSNWIDTLKSLDEPVLKHVVLFNPRRPNFPIHDPSASYDQIKWEFEWLEKCDFFFMHFCKSESVQPICMYELGRNLVRIQQKFPNDYINRILIVVEKGYSREQDVFIQTKLALGDSSDKVLFYNDNKTKIVESFIMKLKKII